MNFLVKIVQILIILIVIYFWNKFVVTKVIKGMVNFHKKYTNVDKNAAIKFFIKNQNNFINFGKYFYWFGALLISIGILFN